MLLTRYQLKMSALDRVKEQVAYFKLWLGVAIVTDISVVGWLITRSETAEPRTVFLAVIGVALLTMGIGVLHRDIGQRIDEIGKL